MIVCLCKGVSSRTILDEVRRGACTVKSIAQACEAGRDCGSCVPQIRELIGTAGVSSRARGSDAPSAR
ncbi:MAG: (2Fe-2S)-binding protein [Myxococcales bacterium]|nr:(2Fe-2S)-binding protein [Myxococcales bacterium]